MTFSNISISFQLPDTDLNRYYSPLEVDASSEDDSSRKPVVIRMRNVSFCYKATLDPNEQNESTQNFFLKSVSGEIKKVCSIESHHSLSICFEEAFLFFLH